MTNIYFLMWPLQVIVGTQRMSKTGNVSNIVITKQEINTCLVCKSEAESERKY